MKPLFYALLLCSLTILFSCKKSETEDTPAATSQPVKRPFGQTVGAAITKTIDAAGGVLESADKSFRLTIPAGAVTTATQFSVQPVESTLPGVTRNSFRLLPEGVTFQKPVTVSFFYAGVDLTGTTEDLLMLAYQDAQGYYHLATETVVNKATKTISVQTTHFSDWLFVERLKLVTDKTGLKPGESAQLKLMYYSPTKLEDVAFPELGELVEYNVPAGLQGIQWNLSGEGIKSASGPRCTYTAPNHVPAENPVTVSVRVKVYNFQSKTYSSEAILLQPLAIVGDEYLIYTFDGQTHTNLPGQIDMSVHEAVEGGGFYITAVMTNQYDIFMRIVDVTAPGTYPFGTDDFTSYLDMSPTVDHDVTDVLIAETYKCNNCDITFSSGGIVITKRGAVGDYVEGTFTAEVWPTGVPGAAGKSVTGKFRKKREE